MASKRRKGQRKRRDRKPTPRKDSSPERDRPTVSGRRKWLFRLVAVTVMPALFLLLLNAGLWVCGYGYPTDFFVKIDGRAAYTTNRRFGRRFFPRAIARTPATCELADPKPDGAYRVFVLGGSAAMGEPQPAFSFGRYLEAMLRDAFPRARFEVINAAMTAINSHVVREIARDCARHRADLFVVYMGNNEVIGPYGCGTVFTGHFSSRAAIRTSIWLKSTRIGQLMNSLYPGGDRPTNWKGLGLFLENQVAADDPGLGDVRGHFRANTADILSTAMRAGAKAVLCTVATNVRDCAPFGSLHAEDLGEPQRAQWQNHYEAGIRFAAAGEHGRAVEAFLAAAAIDDRRADLAFRLGRCYLALKQFDKARESLTRARELDTIRARADSHINRIIRELAAANAGKGVVLVDAERVFEENDRTPHRMPGNELFYEHVHMNPEGNYVLARAVFEKVREILPERIRTRAAPGVAAASRERCHALIALTAWDRHRLAKAIHRMMGRPPFTNQLDYEQQRLARIRELRVLKSRGTSRVALREACRLYRDALERSPGDFELRHNFARLLLRVGEPETSAEQLRMLLARLPDIPKWRQSLGDVLRSKGDFNGAVAEYREAMRIDPGWTKAMHLNIGYTYMQQGRLDEASEHTRLALEMDEDFAQAHLNLATILAQQGRLPEATRHCRRALAIEPENSEACHNLGKALAQQQSFEEAAVHLRKTVELRPDHAPSRCSLAYVLEKLRSRSEAIEHYKKALAIQPGYKDAREALERLRSKDHE